MSVQFASFYLGDDLYGINILQIREVIQNPEYSPVPQAPAIVEGLMNLRGQIVTVIDTSRSLGFPEAEDRSTCIILKTDEELGAKRLAGSWVVSVGQDTVGLLVERMGEVVDLSEEEIDASPANASEQASSYILGIAKLEGELMTLLDLSHVLEF